MRNKHTHHAWTAISPGAGAAAAPPLPAAAAVPPPAAVSRQIDVCNVVVFPAVLADAPAAALLHQHLVTQRQVECQLDVRDAGQLLCLRHSPARSENMLY